MNHAVAILAASAFGALIGNLIVWTIISAFYGNYIDDSL